MARFRGVRRDLEREIAGDMCTVEQARRYLEHLEIVLLLELGWRYSVPLLLKLL